jgi:hypothetical protein
VKGKFLSIVKNNGLLKINLMVILKTITPLKKYKSSTYKLLFVICSKDIIEIDIH